MAASMEAIRATHIGIVTDCVARHFQDLTNTIEELAAMVIHVVLTNTLVGKEVAILTDRKMLVFKERVKLRNRTARRILHEFAKELCKRLERQAFVHEVEDTINDIVVDRFTLVVDHAIGDLHTADIIGIELACDRLGNVEQGVEGFVVSSSEASDRLGERRMVTTHRLGNSINNCGDGLVGFD